MKHHLRSFLHGLVVTTAILSLPSVASAQLSTNPDKFLGNITTEYQVDYGNEPFYTLWNQITPENESKWDQIEGNSRGNFFWYNCDKAYQYAQNNHFPFKFHCLIWGSQYPNWMNSLSTDQQYEAIVEWMDAIKAHYPDLQLIDVVNEAVAGHQPAPYKAALGGDGVTGYDWIIKAFEMAHERWPNAILIYNDYNTFEWQKQQFIELVRTLRDAGAPIDAYGCQSHDLTDMDITKFKAAMTEIQNALKMPMYCTEYDIATTDDAYQKQRYEEQIPVMWESDYCAGITLWGYIYGKTWTTNGNSGIIRNGSDRPAMTWLREYMQSAEARQAKSPFPGMVKEASVYVRPKSIRTTIGEAMPITVDATLRTKTIDHVDLYLNNNLLGTLSSAPYTFSYTPMFAGRYNLKAIVTATDGTTYSRDGGFDAFPARTPFSGVAATLPGTLEVENFDCGVEGIAYHDSDTNDEGKSYYRNDNGGVDIVTGNGGHAIGYTAEGEWLEYTVDITQTGTYTYEAVASSGTTGSGFHLSLVEGNHLTDLFRVSVSQTADNSWDTYKSFSGTLSQELPEGRHVLRLTIDKPYCNIDKIIFKCAGSSIDGVSADADTDGDAYNLMGMKVSSGYKGLVIKNGKKVIVR